jgi:hypothetical protein
VREALIDSDSVRTDAGHHPGPFSPLRG